MKQDARFQNEIKQFDRYYQPSYRKFLRDTDEVINEWLLIGIRGNNKI